jgi:hypothetical protein
MTATTNPTLTWNQAVDLAFEPTPLDLTLQDSPIFASDRRIGPHGKLTNASLVRERAALAYIRAHEGEMARVTYSDPETVNDNARVVFAATGELKNRLVTFPRFDCEDARRIKAEKGFILGADVIPLRGVTSIEVESDRATVTL